MREPPSHVSKAKDLREARPSDVADGEVTLRKKGRHWAVLDVYGELVCVTVYKRGAIEVKRRLSRLPGTGD